MVQGAQALFSVRTGQGDPAGLADARRVLVTARPVLLQRALTNLVDNALKFGRRAEVRLEASSERAVISVEDEGSELTVEDIEAVLAPFLRGANTEAIDGFGLGLTIVATVAEQHGGSLSFEQGCQGLCARLEILRHYSPSPSQVGGEAGWTHWSGRVVVDQWVWFGESYEIGLIGNGDLGTLDLHAIGAQPLEGPAEVFRSHAQH